MKYKLFISIVTLLFLFLCCNNRITEKKEQLYVIDFEQCMATEQAMKISEIADTVEYLELKTPKNIIITRILDIIPIEDFFIIHSRDGIFKFTQKGEYVTTISHRGQGPKEYNLVFGIEVDPIKKELIIADSGQTLFYDLDGNFLRRKKTGTLFKIAISDSTLWIGELAHRTVKFIAFALNQKGDTIATIPNPHYGMKSLDAGMGISYSKFFKPFYRNSGSLYLKGKEMNDTIFQLSGKDRVPYVYLNMGKYKLPIEYEPWYSDEAFIKNGARYWGIPAVAEDDRYLYLLAQRYSSIDGNNYGHNEENFRYIIYDKKKGKGFITKDNKRSKITDDILGGPSVWPRWTTDDYYMNVVEWYDLSNEIKEGKYTLASSLKKQFSEFGYNTNTLIVLWHKKK